MQTSSFARTAAFACAAAAIAFPLTSFAQAYPSKPVRLVVPFPAGGFSDLLIRIMTPRLTERLGQPAVVDNRPGASGNIAAELVAKSPPDGYVLLVNSGNFASNAAIYSKLPFDSFRDFAWVTLLAEAPLVVVVHPSLPAKSVKELVALARSRPGELNYASSGVGTTGHMAGELLKSMAKINMVHIAYKGGIPNMTAVLSGEASVTFPNLPAAVPHIKNGKLRALATTAARRSQLLKTIPTVAESGYPGFDLAGWLGIAAPAGTPPEVIKRLHSDFVTVLKQPDTQAKYIEQGADPVGNTPAEFGAYVEGQVARLKKIIAVAGIRTE